MSPSLQTMGFFMSDINFCNTKEQLNHLGEVVTGKVDGSPTGADIETSTLPYTGQVRNTLPALEELYLGEINEFIQESDQVITDKTAELDAAVDSFIQESNQVISDKTSEFDTSIANKEAEASAAIDSYRLLSKGDYATGILLKNKFEFIEYNGEAYFATNPPYTTTATLPDADGNLFISGYTTFENVANKIGNTNLLSNHNFINKSPDEITHPSVTPTDYVAGTQVFSGVFVGDDIVGLTYIDGRVSWTSGTLYLSVPNSGALEYVEQTYFVASVADFDGKPRTRGVSFSLIADSYRVTVGVDALTDTDGNDTPLGSVKFEQGKVATGHEVSETSKFKEWRQKGDIRGWGAKPGDLTQDSSFAIRDALKECMTVFIPSNAGAFLMSSCEDAPLYGKPAFQINNDYQTIYSDGKPQFVFNDLSKGNVSIICLVNNADNVSINNGWHLQNKTTTSDDDSFVDNIKYYNCENLHLEGFTEGDDGNGSIQESLTGRDTTLPGTSGQIYKDKVTVRDSKFIATVNLKQHNKTRLYNCDLKLDRNRKFPSWQSGADYAVLKMTGGNGFSNDNIMVGGSIECNDYSGGNVGTAYVQIFRAKLTFSLTKLKYVRFNVASYSVAPYSNKALNANSEMNANSCTITDCPIYYGEMSTINIEGGEGFYSEVSTPIICDFKKASKEYSGDVINYVTTSWKLNSEKYILDSDDNSDILTLGGQYISRAGSLAAFACKSADMTLKELNIVGYLTNLILLQGGSLKISGGTIPEYNGAFIFIETLKATRLYVYGVPLKRANFSPSDVSQLDDCWCQTLSHDRVLTDTFWRNGQEVVNVGSTFTSQPRWIYLAGSWKNYAIT